jgi:hypothetical protein
MKEAPPRRDPAAEGAGAEEPLNFFLGFFKQIGYNSIMRRTEGRPKPMSQMKLLGTYTDLETYEAIRRAAYEERSSVSGVLRKAVQEYLAKRKGKKR